MIQRIALCPLVALGWGLFLTLTPQPALAHNLSYALAEASFKEDRSFVITIQCHIASFVLEARPGELPPAKMELLRSLTDTELEERIAESRKALSREIVILVDGKRLTVDRVEFPDADTLRMEPELGSRQSLALPSGPLPVIRVLGKLPPDAERFSMTFPVNLGSVMLRIRNATAPPVVQMLSPRQESWPFLLETETSGATPPEPGRSGNTVTVRREVTITVPLWLVDTLQWLRQGFLHILPRGWDHVLFVLGLFLLSTKFKTLLWQVTAFTLAHTVTLALAAYGIVSLPMSIVEPLIALSIAYVAIENILTTKLHAWRPMIVFLFGLLHGLGFAGVLLKLGLPEDDKLLALLSFNVGVEVGQLAVIVIAFLAVGWFRNRSWYRSRITVPGSCFIAFFGVYWAVQRILQGTFFQGA